MPRRSSRRSSSKRAGSSVAAEVQRLFKAGDQVDTLTYATPKQIR